MKNQNCSKDYSSGNYIFMPAHPEADENGYVDITKPGFVTEMVQMVLLAKKNYQANALQKVLNIPVNKV